ncbi:MAG TPA: L-threonylcarbamoyladenylate synthase [Caulobacteraceae bacterium]|nr:L-threonylcarbamoyladenylate synthase [Caulobacteraceae bacterium]
MTQPSFQEIGEAAEVLRQGGLVLMPTETVYGLAADATNPVAVAAVYAAKGRPSFNPLIAHVADIAAAGRLVALDGRAKALAEAFWPGPLTLVAPALTDCPICDLARAGLDSVAVRAPAHPAALALLEAFGGPVCAPSANRSGRPSPTTLSAAMEETGIASGAAIEGGPCRVGLESTVVSVLDGPMRLLRPGGLSREQIEAVVGPLVEAQDDAARSPGRMTRHYAPRAPLRLDAEAPAPGEAYLAFGPWPTANHVFNLSAAGDVDEAAHRLFAALREADRLNPTAIAVAPIPRHGLGEAINDRLKRAAGFIG